MTTTSTSGSGSTADLLTALNKNGSGLNLGSLAQTLATAEVAPRQAALARRIEGDAVKLSALGQLRAQVTGLGSTLASVAVEPVLTVTTSAASILPSVTDRNKLQGGTTEVEVVQLAQRQVLEFTGFSAAEATVAPGRLTVELGSWKDGVFSGDGARSVTLDVAEGTTLAQLAEQLSGISGVTARVLNKGDGSYSLGLVSETGAGNALRLTASGDAGTGDLALTALDTTSRNAEVQVQAAGDAKVIVDGILISRSGNTLNDVLPGMSLTISSVGSGSLGVAREAATAQRHLETLIGGLNQTFSLLSSLTASGVNGATSGDLAGDRAIKALEQSLRNLLARPLTGFGGKPVTLAEMGVQTQKDGSLTLNTTTFTRAFEAAPERMDAILGDSLVSLTEGLSVSGVPDDGLAAGLHEFKVAADGSATLDGYRMSAVPLADGRIGYTAQEGPVRQLSVVADAGVTAGRLQFGRSFLAELATVLDQATANDGAISGRESGLTAATADATQQLEALDARAAILERRYMTRFAAMEQVVTRMNNTGSYLKNLVSLWNKAD